jgi:hypothetical protein
MAQKMLFCFTDPSADILEHILGYSFCAKRHILALFFPNAVAIEGIKNYQR